MSLQLLKDDRAPSRTVVDVPEDDEIDPFKGIRCPQCGWRPTASSRWHCIRSGTPEPFFNACGTVWNTFTTRGRCPGCRHQWRWTTCLSCHQHSLHEDWYEKRDAE